jgi:pimeloyl-ACP methyl ester carboxylesterase
MSRLKWILSVLLAPLSRERSLPLVRPTRIDWNPSLSPRTIQIKENMVFYVVKGEREPLVLIHGYGAGFWVWEKQIDILSRYYKVYALDLLGHGYSDRPRIEYRPETYINFLKDFMDGVGVQRATLIGNSMGGGIAWAGAALFPERVKKLILIDCVPPDVLNQVKNESFRALAVIKNIPFLPYLVISSRNKSSIRKVLEECICDVARITPEVVNRQYDLNRIKGTSWVLTSTLKNARDTSRLKASLSRISHPTLLIWGEKDLIFPPSVGETLHRAIKASKLIVIEKSGHIPMWETPDEVNPAILDFLEEE